MSCWWFRYQYKRFRLQGALAETNMWSGQHVKATKLRMTVF